MDQELLATEAASYDRTKSIEEVTEQCLLGSRSCGRYASCNILIIAYRESSSWLNPKNLTANLSHLLSRQNRVVISVKTLLFLGLLLSYHFPAVIATPLDAASHLESRADGVCSQGIYGELFPYLVHYATAEAYCPSVYPIHCTTARIERAATSTRMTTTTSTDLGPSAWSRARKEPNDVLSTLCSCIETPRVSVAAGGQRCLLKHKLK